MSEENSDNMGHNQVDVGLVRSAVLEVQEQQAKIDEINDQAKKDSQPFKDKIKEIKDKAAENGLAKKPLNAVIARNRHQAKADAAGNALNDEAQETFEQMCLALDQEAD